MLSGSSSETRIGRLVLDPHGCKVDQQVGLCWKVLVCSVGFAKGVTGGFASLHAGETPQ